VISSSRKQVISKDSMGLLDGYFSSSSKENPRDNLLLYKGIPMPMGPYTATFIGDSTAPGDPKHYYRVSYVRKDTSTGKIIESFTLVPDAFINPKGQDGLIANPSSKHYWNHDIFTYLTSVIDPSKVDADTAQYHSYIIQPGDSIFLSNGFMIFTGLSRNIPSSRFIPQPGEVAVGADLKIFTNMNQEYKAQPIYALSNSGQQEMVPDTVAPINLFLQFARVIPQKKKIELLVKQSNVNDNYIVLKAYVFPYINVLWLGTIIMVIGFGMSITQRIKGNTSKNKKSI
ncbi:MAG: hypothetical protein ACYCOO_10370, partial [Chitinophagaceae bacterium]